MIKAKHNYIILICLFLFGFLKSQDIDVVYKLTMKPNKNDKNYVENDIFILQIRKNSSVFFSKAYHDMMANLGNPDLKKVNINKISSNYIITKVDEELFHHVRIESDFIKYKESILPKWKILNEFKKIDSLNCQKAVTNFRGRNYTAYFTKDIPLPEGPYKFKNLPGLVLEVYSNDNDYHFILDGIIKANSDLFSPKSLLVKDRNKYLQEIRKFAENPSYKQQQRNLANGDFKYKTTINGKEVNDSEKYKMMNQFVWKFMDTHNNPIEKDDIWIRQ